MTSEGLSVGLCCCSALFGKPLVFGGSFKQQWMCCSVCVQGTGRGGSGFIKVDLEGGAR